MVHGRCSARVGSRGRQAGGADHASVGTESQGRSREDRSAVCCAPPPDCKVASADTGTSPRARIILWRLAVASSLRGYMMKDVLHAHPHAHVHVMCICTCVTCAYVRSADRHVIFVIVLNCILYHIRETYRHSPAKGWSSIRYDNMCETNESRQAARFAPSGAAGTCGSLQGLRGRRADRRAG